MTDQTLLEPELVDLATGWKHDPEEPVRVYIGPDAIHLLGTPIPDHVPVDGEIICRLSAGPRERVIFPSVDRFSCFSIETDGTVRWRL